MTRTPVPRSSVVRTTHARVDVPDIIEFVTDPQLLGLSISLAQRTLLNAIYGMPLTDDELVCFRQCTGRTSYPAHPFSEITVIAGARAGKDSRIAAPTALYEAIFGGHERHVAKGETATIPLVAQDTRGASVAFGYIRDYLRGSPLLATKLADEPLTSSLTLTNGISIQTFPCTLKSLRGFSIPCGVMDELGFFRLEDAADSDVEVQSSIRRGMVSFPHTRLLKISTPYMKGGVLYADFKRAFGTDDPDLLVWRAGSMLMNPSLRPERLERERRLDLLRYAREYEAQFTDDLEAFLATVWIEGCVIPNRHALAPQLDRFIYFAGIDQSGGGADAFTASIVHPEGTGPAIRYVQDYLKGFPKPRTGTIDLEAVTAEIATVFRGFNCDQALADGYSKQWVVQAFARNGMTLVAAPTKSECYAELEPLIARGSIALLDHPQQTRELGLLERHARPGGKLLVDHPRGGHDDYSNALALATYAALQAAMPTVDLSMSDDEVWAIRRMQMHLGEFPWGFPPDEIAGNFLKRF